MILHLETEDCLIRPLKIEDAPGMFEMDRLPAVHQFLGKSPVEDLDNMIEIIKGIRNQYVQFGIGRCAVISKVDHRFMGWSGFKWETREINNRSNYIDFGYRFHPDFWGRGMATAVGMALLEWAKSETDWTEAYARTMKGNLASQKVLKNLNFKYLGDFIENGEPTLEYRLKF